MKTDIADRLPQESLTVQAIYDWHKRQGDAEPVRGYLGASLIGERCERALWYRFRWCNPNTISGRIYSLFETGDAEEPRMVERLRGIGCTVHEQDTETGRQFGFKAIGGHFSGHSDGVGLGIPEAPKTWHNLEFKTHKDSSFNKLKRDGIKKAFPTHWAQMMVYMGQLKLTRSLYLAKNKDTDELWSDRVRYDAKEHKQLLDKAERIIRANQPPDRCATRPDTYACKFCDSYDLCWGTSNVAVPLPCKTCRTCCHATPEVDEGETWARWSCNEKEADLTINQQQEACPAHLLIPDLISFAEPTDSGASWIEFTNKDTKKAVWRHGAGTGSWTTEELMKAPGPIVGDLPTTKVKNAFAAVVSGMDDVDVNLIEKYPTGDSELVWDGDANFADTIQDELGKALEVPSGEPMPEPIDTFKDDAHEAYEFRGGILLVVYKEENYAAIWKGKK
jgi:hypothetical protein